MATKWMLTLLHIYWMCTWCTNMLSTSDLWRPCCLRLVVGENKQQSESDVLRCDSCRDRQSDSQRDETRLIFSDCHVGRKQAISHDDECFYQQHGRNMQWRDNIDLFGSAVWAAPVIKCHLHRPATCLVSQSIDWLDFLFCEQAAESAHGQCVLLSLSHWAQSKQNSCISLWPFKIDISTAFHFKSHYSSSLRPNVKGFIAPQVVTVSQLTSHRMISYKTALIRAVVKEERHKAKKVGGQGTHKSSRRDGKSVWQERGRKWGGMSTGDVSRDNMRYQLTCCTSSGFLLSSHTGFNLLTAHL